MKLDTANYKGVRDFYPEDMFIREYIFSVWNDVLQSYGYESYDASTLESAEIYEGKTSEEIVSEQTYTFEDRGGRRVTLRPEMTPTLARMVAKKRRQLSFPLRWYSIPNLFRYERPQRGRLREHWQLNVDIMGIAKTEAEIELIEISSKIMTSFGLKQTDFVVKVNDRKILEDLATQLNLEGDKKKAFYQLLDRKDKVDNFDQQMQELLGRPFDLVIKPNEKIQEMLNKLQGRGITNVVFDPNLVRGFDYYTGIVFELYDTSSENKRAVFGGGRYDNLLEIFGEEKVPTVGFGMGDVVIRDILESRGLLPQKMSAAHLYVCTFGEQTYSYAISLANEMRAVGLDVIVDYTDKKIGDQIRFADKKGIPFIICVGEDEITKERFKIKDLRSGKEKVVKRSLISEFVKNNL